MDYKFDLEQHDEEIVDTKSNSNQLFKQNIDQNNKEFKSKSEVTNEVSGSNKGNVMRKMSKLK